MANGLLSFCTDILVLGLEYFGKFLITSQF